MAGIDKIIEEILKDGRAQAKEKTDVAEKQAEEIRTAAEAEAKALAEEADARTQREKEQILERAQSSGDMQKRQAILSAKQELISYVLEQAYERLLGLEEDAYFAFLESLLEQHALPKEGVLYLNEKDKSRMPAGFEENAKRIGSAKGSAIIISEETRQMDGGFVLVYGGIEENCSLSALFRDRRDELSDLAGSVLFV